LNRFYLEFDEVNYLIIW